MMLTISKLDAVVRVGGFGLAAMLLAGCSMGNMIGGGGTSTSQQFANASPTQAELAQATPPLPAIATECPPIRVRPGGEALFSYGSGQVGNARDLQYQAVIDRQSRNCVVSNGQITVRMGVVGRFLQGPAGNQSSATLPLRFAVERDEVAVFSEKYDIPVAITPPNQSEEFVKVVENVTIPYVGGENIVIWVGFDTRG
ncbi:hypothetical protein EMQ25_09870 [Arsenicitalea aurantiaca]|uniref:Lipoprotein n=1 Tax=Arsenicitalea aurantiaca TaxID=1783274 RepID=A0A433XAP9_9HYPH|nr:hypothetical protein [Arsenicitalea aurantiaca]RUT31167.1 hypothetical protein EMQ25_09870 [Arsenicitalea aurantiaca]